MNSMYKDEDWKPQEQGEHEQEVPATTTSNCNAKLWVCSHATVASLPAGSNMVARSLRPPRSDVLSTHSGFSHTSPGNRCYVPVHESWYASCFRSNTRPEMSVWNRCHLNYLSLRSWRWPELFPLISTGLSPLPIP